MTSAPTVIEGLDWACTPLGPQPQWSSALRTTHDIMMSAHVPMCATWGPERTFFYNAAYVPFLGQRHPAAMGQPIQEVWFDVWSDIEPLIAQAMAGERVYLQDMHLAMTRNGYKEDTYWTFSYSPLWDGEKVVGFLNIASDTTETVLHERRRDAAEHAMAASNTSLKREVSTRTEERDAFRVAARLSSFHERVRDLDEPGAMAAVAAEVMGTTLNVSAAAYATMDADDIYIHVEQDWTAGATKLTGRYLFENYGSYVDNLRRGESVVISDVTHDPRTTANADAFAGLHIRSLINLPIMERGRMVAAFFVVSTEARHWTPEELVFVQEIAVRARDAIERRRAELRLREMNGLLTQQVNERTQERNRIWDVSRDMLLVADTAGVWLSVNPAWTACLGWTAEELVGRTSEWLEHPEDHDKTRREIGKLAQGQTTFAFENRIRTRSGEYRMLSWTAVVADNRIYATARDVTEERVQTAALLAAEEALRQSQKMEAVGQLTGGLAHDFNNLLAGISGSLELMNTRILQGRLKDVERYMVAAQGAAKRAAALTHRLLAFSRRQTLTPKATDVNVLAQGMLDMIRRTVGPSVEVQFVGMGGLWSALVDPPQLENALLNLCINARDAMPGGGRIIIETVNREVDRQQAGVRDMPRGQYLVVSVSDTGTGMTPDVIARAFDPFFTTKPIGEGTGLGLSMIYGFARQSGGQVRIHSLVGEGTTVSIYLPRHQGLAEAEEVLPDATLLPIAKAGETVLIVDDEPTVRMLVTDVLGDLGYISIEAADGAGGLKVLQSDVRIDLLISDVGLPGGMNGRQMADAARVGRPSLKVLFITGFAENALLSNGHLEPGMAVLTKPFSVDVLGARIREMISVG